MSEHPQTVPNSLLLSIEEAALELRISRTSLYELLQAGSLRSMKVGRRRLVSRDFVVAFIQTAIEEEARLSELGTR